MPIYSQHFFLFNRRKQRNSILLSSQNLWHDRKHRQNFFTFILTARTISKINNFFHSRYNIFNVTRQVFLENVTTVYAKQLLIIYRFLQHIFSSFAIHKWVYCNLLIIQVLDLDCILNWNHIVFRKIFKNNIL